MTKVLNALFLGDIFGQPGSRAVFLGLKGIVKRFRSDFIVANGENIAEGFGITPELAETLFSQGINVITTGNHVWQKREVWETLNTRDNLLRPANYPPGVPGKGVCTFEVKNSKITVINLQGRQKMSDLDCPLRIGKDLVKKARQITRNIFIDFHAEATEEKETLGFYLDGLVTAVVGTHTHVQTADSRILPKGTAYITDLGMTGPKRSVIGVNTEIAIQRSLTQMPLKMEPADSEASLCGVSIAFDSDTGRAVSIEPFQEELQV